MTWGCRPRFRYATKAGDPYFSNVTLLQHWDTINGAVGGAWSLGGTSAIVSAPAHSGFGTCASINGSPNVPSNANNLTISPTGTEAFTIEFWAYANIGAIPFGQLTFYTSQNFRLGVGSSGDFNANCYVGGTPISLTNVSNTQFVYGAWNFCAVSRVTNELSAYVNGSRVAFVTGATANQSINAATATLNLGGSLFGNNDWPGFIDEVRTTRGVGRYSGATCPVPTAPFPDF